MQLLPFLSLKLERNVTVNRVDLFSFCKSEAKDSASCYPNPLGLCNCSFSGDYRTKCNLLDESVLLENELNISILI